MLKINKILNVLIFLALLIGIVYLIYMYMLPYIYNLDNNKYSKCNDDEIYSLSNNIIAKKFEIVLYEDKNNLYDLYTYNNKKKLNDYINSEKYDELRKQYTGYEIKNIYSYNNEIYLVEYNLNYDYKTLTEKMIIKINNNYAIILDDSML